MGDETKQKIDDGGPAFPTDSEHQPQSHVFHHEGMSTRTWLMGMSIMGRRANPGFPPTPQGLAVSALEDADAAIAQLREDADQ